MSDFSEDRVRMIVREEFAPADAKNRKDIHDLKNQAQHNAEKLHMVESTVNRLSLLLEGNGKPGLVADAAETRAMIADFVSREDERHKINAATEVKKKEAAEKLEEEKREAADKRDKKVSNIRWMLGFALTLLGAIIGLLVYLGIVPHRHNTGLLSKQPTAQTTQYDAGQRRE